MTQARWWVCRFPAPLLFLVLSTVALAGCASEVPVTSGSGAQDPATEDGWRSGDVGGVTLTLDDIPDGDEWVVVEARVPTSASIGPGDRIEMITRIELDPWDSPEPCFTMGAKEFGLQFRYLGSHAAVTVTPAREEPVYEHREVVPGRGLTFEFSAQMPFPDDRRSYHLVSVANLAEWDPSTLEMETTIYEGQPVEWRIVDSGSTTCQGELFEHRQGEVVTAGVRTVAWNLQDAFSLERYGWGTVFVSEVEAHEAELSGPNGTVWSSSTLAANQTGFLRALPEGSYTFNAPHLTGSASASAGWHVLDVPLWVSEMMTLDASDA